MFWRLGTAGLAEELKHSFRSPAAAKWKGEGIGEGGKGKGKGKGKGSVCVCVFYVLPGF